LDEPLDEAGFRHVATSVGLRLGAQRIGASVYQAEAGFPIWPYHYHHGIEEWLYVIAGAPVLREPAGERILTPGDLVCFPSGHLGAHTLKGPGRLVIFSTGQDVEPYMSVYPDSDKVGGPEGILLRNSAVSYWHGEGTAGPSESVEIVREPERSLPQPAVNALALREEEADPDAPAGFRYRAAKLGPLLGADRLGGTVVDVDPGEGSELYHYVYGREEWCSSWPERPPCASRKVRIISRPAILCASRKAQPVLTGCSIAATRSCARCSYRRRVCQPMFATRTPGTG
jgi:uncharacterized cupin superfamily protein